MYYTYILKCSDSTLYTGFTNDLEKRVKAHNEGNRGAKYTKGRRPVELVYFEKFEDESSAKKREWEIKKLNKTQKILLLKSFHPNHSQSPIISV